ENPGIALEGHADRQVRVAGGDDGEHRHARDVVGRLVELAAALEGPGPAPGERGEDYQEHEGEHEREEGGGRVPPERLVRIADLPGRQRQLAHAGTSSEAVSSR